MLHSVRNASLWCTKLFSIVRRHWVGFMLDIITQYNMFYIALFSSFVKYLIKQLLIVMYPSFFFDILIVKYRHLIWNIWHIHGCISGLVITLIMLESLLYIYMSGCLIFGASLSYLTKIKNAHSTFYYHLLCLEIWYYMHVNFNHRITIGQLCSSYISLVGKQVGMQ